MKPKKGRLKLDSARYLQGKGWTENVIDIDTYGAPWNHWLAMLTTVAEDPRPLTVFLTIGLVMNAGAGKLPDTVKRILGLTFEHFPPGLMTNLHELGTTAAIAQARRRGFEISECLEAPRARNARYIGIRLIPAP